MLTLTNCTVSRNSTSYGARGVWESDGTLALTNCSISGNYAGGNGGGLFSGGTTTLTNCTVSGNYAHSEAGGLGQHGRHADADQLHRQRQFHHLDRRRPVV